MITTPREKNLLILEYLWMIDKYGYNYSLTLSNEDYEEASADAMIAISKAVDAFDDNKGATLKTFIARYIINSFKHFYNIKHGKRRSRQAVFEQSAIPFSSLSPDGSETPDSYGKTDPDQSGRIWKELVIRGLSSPRKRRILNMRLDGLTFIEIGRRVGITKQRAHQVYESANAEIRANIDKECGNPKENNDE